MTKTVTINNKTYPAVEQYHGEYEDNTYTVIPTWNRTDDNEVKCEVKWLDGRVDFIWFDDTGTELISRLNPDIRVSKVA